MMEKHLPFSPMTVNLLYRYDGNIITDFKGKESQE